MWLYYTEQSVHGENPMLCGPVQGVNYFRCYASADVRYRRYEWGDISSIVGFNIHVKGITEQAEYKLFNPDYNLITQIDNLRLHFSFRADNSVEGCSLPSETHHNSNF